MFITFASMPSHVSLWKQRRESRREAGETGRKEGKEGETMKIKSLMTIHGPLESLHPSPARGTRETERTLCHFSWTSLVPEGKGKHQLQTKSSKHAGLHEAPKPPSHKQETSALRKGDRKSPGNSSVPLKDLCL